MKVKDLILILEKFDPELQVICTRCSDYQFIEDEDISLVKALRRADGCWVTREHHSMSDEDKSKLETYLHFSGN